MRKLLTSITALTLVGGVFLGTPARTRATAGEYWISTATVGDGTSCAAPTHEYDQADPTKLFNDILSAILFEVDALDYMSVTIAICEAEDGSTQRYALDTDTDPTNNLSGAEITIVGVQWDATSAADFADMEDVVIDGATDWSPFEFDNADVNIGYLSIENAWDDNTGAAIHFEQDDESEYELYLEHVAIDNSVIEQGLGAGVYAEGSATIVDSYFTANEVNNGLGLELYGGAVYVYGDLSVEHSEFDSNIADYGGAIFVEDGSLTISDDSWFYDNEARNGNGGAVYATVGSPDTVTIDSSTFGDPENDSQGNYSLYGGGDLYIYGGASLDQVADLTISNSAFYDGTVNDGIGGSIASVCAATVLTGVTIRDAYANDDGGGLWASDAAGCSSGDYTATISNSRFLENEAGDQGGAVYADGAVTVDASAFTGNESDDLGGAIYSGGELQVTDSQFDSNITENYGGAIYAAAGISVSDSAFEANSATSVDGGAIYADTGEVSVSNTDFSNNEAFNAGGALYIFDADAIAAISDSTFNSNSADYGGAIVSYDSEVAITDSHFEENFTVWESEEMGADFGGAAYYLWLGSLHVEDSTFTRNVAPDTSAGAGIHLYKGSLEVDNSTFTANQAGQGPAIYSWGEDLGFEEDESVVISDSTFLRNRNTWLDDGGAIAHERNGRDFTLTGSLFRGNVGPRWGGAVETWKVDGETTIENNVFMLNTAREGGALWIDVRNGVEGIRGNQFKKNRARLGGAISFECETVSARSVVRVLTRQNRFSGNVASTRRSSSNAFASQYVQSSDEDCAPTPP